MRVEPLSGDSLAKSLPAVAQLRIEVFRAYPYLYDGTLVYEENYIAKFATALGAVIVAALDGDRIVGIATGSPLAGHANEFGEPFQAAGLDIGAIFYCGESVLLPAYRGQGIGHRFFDAREAHARSLGGFTHSAFCSVVRPSHHPLRPPDYQPLDRFWEKRGYRPVGGLVARFAWKDIDRQMSDEKPMQFWMRSL